MSKMEEKKPSGNPARSVGFAAEIPRGTESFSSNLLGHHHIQNPTHVAHPHVHPGSVPASPVLLSKSSRGLETNSVSSAAAIKKVRKVRFNPYVHKLRLPFEEAEDANKARKSKVKEAPYHDELWDGDVYAFRERELTADELWALRIKAKVSSMPKRLKRGLKALQFLVPGINVPVDVVSAHAKKSKGESSAGSTPLHNTLLGSRGGMDAFDDFDVEKEDDGGAYSTNSGKSDRSKLKRRMSATRPRELSVDVDITPATFEHYSNLTKIMNDLIDVPEDLNTASEDLVRHREEMNFVKDELRRIRFELPELERRLNRNANPRLLHYMQPDRDGKVKRLEEECDATIRLKQGYQKRVEELADLIYKANERLENLGVQLSRLRGAEAEKIDIERVVVSEFGKADSILSSLHDQLDECKSCIDKEHATEKKLRKASQVISDVVMKQGLIPSIQALKEAQDFVSLASGGGGGSAGSGFGSSQDSRSMFSSVLATGPPNKGESSLFSRGEKRGFGSDMGVSRGGSSASQSSSITGSSDSSLALKRREALNRARETAFSAMATLDITLDDVEETCGQRWGEAILSWRKEVPKLHSAELFGVARKSFSGIEDSSLIKGVEEDKSLSAMREKIDRKVTAMHRFVTLTKRYVEFFNREAARSADRLLNLLDQKKSYEDQAVARKETIFQHAKDVTMGVADNGGVVDELGGALPEEDVLLPAARVEPSELMVSAAASTLLEDVQPIDHEMNAVIGHLQRTLSFNESSIAAQEAASAAATTNEVDTSVNPLDRSISFDAGSFMSNNGGYADNDASLEADAMESFGLRPRPHGKNPETNSLSTSTRKLILGQREMELDLDDAASTVVEEGELNVVGEDYPPARHVPIDDDMSRI